MVMVMVEAMPIVISYYYTYIQLHLTKKHITKDANAFVDLNFWH